MAFSYPLMLDVSSRPIVIVGGGNVAARKAKTLLDAGARCVRMVAMSFGEDVPEGVQRVEGSYQENYLEGAGLVFAATDSAEVNERVVVDARARGILVCRADWNGEFIGDFSTPAMLRKGQVTVTVSAGSPALSAVIRDQIEALWDRRWTAMAQAMESLRPEILAAGLRADQRTQIFRELASGEALEILQSAGLAGLRAWVTARHPELDAGTSKA